MSTTYQHLQSVYLSVAYLLYENMIVMDLHALQFVIFQVFVN